MITYKTLWAIIDELRKENNNLKGLNSENEDLQNQYEEK